MAYSEQMGFLRKDEYFFPSPDGSRYSLATIDVYKRQALETANLDLPAESQTSWQKDQSLLSWLQSL